VKRKNRYPVSGKSILMGLSFALAALFIVGCGNEIQPGNTPEKPSATVKAKTVVVQNTARPVIYEAVGAVAPETGAAISARVMGQVREVRVHEGQHVKKGNILIVLNGKTISAQVDQAKAGLDQAKKGLEAARSMVKAASARAKLSEQTYKRYQALLKTDSVSRQEFDEVESAYLASSAALDQSRSMEEAAKGAIKQSQAALAAANSRFSDTIIKAPYDATILDKKVEPGDMATPGRPLLTLEKTGAFEVRTVLPESQINSIQPGDMVSIIIDALGDAHVSGTIRTIEPSADPATRSFAIKISLPIFSGLKSGLFARVRVIAGRSGMIMIPDTAMVSQGELRGVFIVDPQHMARFRLIRPGRRFGDLVEILSGLNEGEQIIVKPDYAIKNGVKVEAL